MRQLWWALTQTETAPTITERALTGSLALNAVLVMVVIVLVFAVRMALRERR